MQMNKRKYLSKQYYDPSSAGSFAGLYGFSKANNNKISNKDLKNFLMTQDTYTLHKQVTRKFKRNSYNVNNIGDLFQVDLCVLDSLSKYNDGYKYILFVIDVFSKYVWGVPLKNKTGVSIIDGLTRVFEKAPSKPIYISSDKGMEFKANIVQKFLKQKNIKFFTTNNPDIKAAVIERFIRTIKGKIFRYLTFKNTLRYIDILDDMIIGYNKSFHRTIKMAPADVNATNILQVWKNTNGECNNADLLLKPKFKIGDKVRISTEKYVFRKGYMTSWSLEYFILTKIIQRKPIVYEISDQKGNPISGTFYENELQLVTIPKDALFQIDKILGEKGKGFSRKLLVSWKGYSSEFNSWIPATSVQNIK